MEEEEKEIIEVPLSNIEVIAVLNERVKIDKNIHPRTLEMMDYINSLGNKESKYPLEVLRTLKIEGKLESDLVTLAVVSNLSDISMLPENDIKVLKKYFKN